MAGVTISGIRMAPTPVPVMAMPRASPRCRENLPTRIFVKDKGEVAQYEAGSDGPDLANELLARDGRKWRPL